MHDNPSSCTSSTPCSTFCARLPAVYVLLHALLFRQRGTLCQVRLTIVFLLHCLWSPLVLGVTSRHNGGISVIPEASLQEQDGSNAYLSMPYNNVENVAVGLPKNTCALSNFLQREYLWYDLRLTPIRKMVVFNVISLASYWIF